MVYHGIQHPLLALADSLHCKSSLHFAIAQSNVNCARHTHQVPLVCNTMVYHGIGMQCSTLLSTGIGRQLCHCNALYRIAQVFFCLLTDPYPFYALLLLYPILLRPDIRNTHLVPLVCSILLSIGIALAFLISTLYWQTHFLAIHLAQAVGYCSIKCYLWQILRYA